MSVRGSFVGLEAADLIEIRDACKGAIIAGTVRGISYTIAGRSFSFPSLESASSTLQEASYALGLLQGTRSNQVRANFNPSTGRNSQ
tara:strand:- start:6254 stop:6514 length:261 start_codon:yes stop_codon:yes gene_type:complete